MELLSRMRSNPGEVLLYLCSQNTAFLEASFLSQTIVPGAERFFQIACTCHQADESSIKLASSVKNIKLEPRIHTTQIPLFKELESG